MLNFFYDEQTPCWQLTEEILWEVNRMLIRRSQCKEKVEDVNVERTCGF